MQRFHRLGSLALGLVMISLTCHLAAISYDRWKTTTCSQCSYLYNFRGWRTSIRQRCYRISLLLLFNSTSDPTVIENDPFASYICIENQFLFPTQPKYYDQCVEYTKLAPNGICTSSVYNTDMCRCE